MHPRSCAQVLWVPLTPFATAGKTLEDVAHGFLRVHRGEPLSKAYGSAKFIRKEEAPWCQEHLGCDPLQCWHCYHPEETAGVLVTEEVVHPEKAKKNIGPAMQALRKWARGRAGEAKKHKAREMQHEL